MLERIFRRHSAVHIGVPLLMPKCSLYEANDAYVCLMDHSGGLVGLPYDSRVSSIHVVFDCNCLLNVINCLFIAIYYFMTPCQLINQSPLPSTIHHPSYGDCLEIEREYYQTWSVLDCVTQCSQSAAHLYEQFLQVQQIGFVTSGTLLRA